MIPPSLPCPSIYIAGYDVVIECSLRDGHPLPHRSKIGQSWEMTLNEARYAEACEGEKE